MDIVVGAVIGCDIVEGDDPSACGSGSSSELESELLELLLEEGRFFFRDALSTASTSFFDPAWW